MVEKSVALSFTVSLRVYDSWTELLAGTRVLLDLMHNHEDKMSKANLLRLSVVSSSQMAEVMFFTQLTNCVKNHSDEVLALLEYDLGKRISFNEAARKWPQIVTGSAFDYGSDPLQSMEKLSALRNSAIHHRAQAPQYDIGESAFHTAIESSKYIYRHFGQDWKKSGYPDFLKDNQAKNKVLLSAVLN